MAGDGLWKDALPESTLEGTHSTARKQQVQKRPGLFREQKYILEHKQCGPGKINDRHIGQWHGLENPEIAPSLYTQLIFSRGCQALSTRKTLWSNDTDKPDSHLSKNGPQPHTILKNKTKKLEMD